MWWIRDKIMNRVTTKRIFFLFILLIGFIALLLNVMEFGSKAAEVPVKNNVSMSLDETLTAEKAYRLTDFTYAYLVDCSGDYIRIDTEKQQIVSRGKIWDGPLGEAIRPSEWMRFDGCLVHGIQHDSQGGLIYIVAPKEGTVDTQGRNHYRIAALKLPNLELIKKVELKPALDTPPAILLTPEGGELLVSYSIAEQSQGKDLWHDVVQRYRVPEFEQVETAEDLYSFSAYEENPMLGLRFSDHAYFDKAGRIVDRNKVLGKDGKILHRTDGYSLLTDSIKQTLRQLERTGVGGRKYLDITFADSAADRLLFVIGRDSENNHVVNGSGLLVYDVEGGHTLSPVVTPYAMAPFDPTHSGTPTAHLTPNGDLIVVEQYEWRDINQDSTFPSDYQRFKTGEIALYDVNTGSLLSKIFLDPPPGFFAHVIGFSPDGKLMYYLSQDYIYGVDLSGNQPPKKLLLSERLSPVAIFFSNR
jgi:hypothetical protein